MRTPIKKFTATGTNAKFLAHLNTLIERVNQLDSIRSPDELISETTAGVLRRPKFKAKSTGIGLIYRGEYVSSEEYSVGDLVVIREFQTGATSGAYICVKDNPGSGNPPQDGVYWVCITKTDTIGIWR